MKDFIFMNYIYSFINKLSQYKPSNIKKSKLDYYTIYRNKWVNALLQGKMDRRKKDKEDVLL